MAKKKKKKYYVYQTGGADPIIDFNLPKFDPNAPFNPDEAPVDQEEEREKMRQMYNDLFMTPKQKNAQRMRELESRGLLDRPERETDIYDQYGYGDPTVQGPKPKRPGIFDPRRTELHPFIRGLNTVVDIATGIGSKINNVRTAKQERREYLDALAPEEYENMERYGLNELPIFTKYGGGVYQTGGQASRQDSLNLYNNSQELLKYYDRYKKKDETPLRTSRKGTFELVDYDNDVFKWSPQALVPNGNKSEIKDLPLSAYRQPIDENRFYQRESAMGILDTRSPMALYDRRIRPTHLTSYLNNIPGDIMHGDAVGIYGYDPLSVKPWDMLTPEEREKRMKLYPPEGSGKSRPPVKFPNHKSSRVKGVDMTGDIQVQGTGIRPADLSQKPTKYSVTVRDENAPSKQRSIYFKDKKAWKNFMDSGAVSPISSEEREDSATSAGYRTMKTGGMNFKSTAAYKKWLAYGHASGEFAATPGHTDVSIKGKGKKVKHQTGGQPQADQYQHNMDDAFYGANATLAHYKGILNEKLKAKNPQAFGDYFKGLVDLRRSGKSEDAMKYVQDTPYNDYLSPQEVQETLGGDHDDYLRNLERVNTYNIKQGKQPLYGGIEGKNENLKDLNYGRRFASLQVTPTYSSSNTAGTSRYTRSYTYDPTLRQINIKEEGDLNRRPSNMSQSQAVVLANNFQFGGQSIPKTKGLPSNVGDLANVEAERGEAYMDFSGDVYQVADDAKTHEQGGEMIPQVHKVLENTSNLRKDRNSKYLKVDPKQFKAITGVNTTKSMSHAEAMVKANETLDKQREFIVKKIKLAGEGKDDIDKMAENSIKLNMDHFAAIPTKQEMFDRLFKHQEAVKMATNIPTGGDAKYGGYYRTGGKTPKYQAGGFSPYPGNTSGMKTPAGNYDAFPAGLTMDQYLKDLQARGFKYEGITNNKQLQQAIYEFTLQNDPDKVKAMWQEGMHQKGMDAAKQLGFVDNKGRFKPGVLDNPENLRKLGELYPDGDLGVRTMQLAAPEKKPRVWTDTPQGNAPVGQQKLDPSIKANIRRGQKVESNFFEPLRWYDTASSINTYLASLERIPEKFNPMEFNQLRYKLADPTAALQQNQGDFNAAVQATQNASGAGAGVQLANIAQLATNKYKMNNQVIGNFENQNSQIKNQEILYNTQVRDKQSAADQQARGIFEDKVLTSKAKQQEQKLTALDSLYKTIAENRALNRNGNLIMKMSRAFDQYGNYNGYQTQFGVNPALGMGTPTTGTGTGKFQPAGGIQGLTPGKSYYNRRTGRTLYFDGINLQERGN